MDCIFNIDNYDFDEDKYNFKLNKDQYLPYKYSLNPKEDIPKFKFSKYASRCRSKIQCNYDEIFPRTLKKPSKKTSKVIS